MQILWTGCENVFTLDISSNAQNTNSICEDYEKNYKLINKSQTTKQGGGEREDQRLDQILHERVFMIF